MDISFESANSGLSKVTEPHQKQPVQIPPLAPKTTSQTPPATILTTDRSVTPKNVQNLTPKQLERCVLVWLDNNTAPTLANVDTLEKLTAIIDDLKVFNEVEFCEEYMKLASEFRKKVVLIVSDSFVGEIVPRVEMLTDVIAVYICCSDEEKDREWSKQYQKTSVLMNKAMIYEVLFVPATNNAMTEQSSSIHALKESITTGQSSDDESSDVEEAAVTKPHS
ncbi:unnamed protein product [Didymodactylos carnosus]|uniref:Uncharacterized protein n=1 Tax=Didymodactylos carnosus TaxID=1234261 RepID=A0A8S2EHL8_9BILA|nr:unnamed protein product [Didymodactylos carnosus]CAF4036537.1 unnamed protein product [Didymodactylos carnosus]